MENSENWAGRFDLSDRNSRSNKEELDTIKTQMAEMVAKHKDELRQLHIKSESTIVELQC